MYQKQVENGYILSVSTGVSRGNITEEEYLEIRSAVQERPAPPVGFGSRLREDLTWEFFELPDSAADEEEISGDELLSMLEGIL